MYVYWGFGLIVGLEAHQAFLVYVHVPWSSVFCENSSSTLSASKSKESMLTEFHEGALLIATYIWPVVNIFSSIVKVVWGSVRPCVLCTVKAKAFWIGN